MGLTCGAFEHLFGTGGREFDRQKSKNSNAREVARFGGGGGGVGGGGGGGGVFRLQIVSNLTLRRGL